MKEYFSCKPECDDCCLTGKNNLRVEVTAGDIYRAFVLDNLAADDPVFTRRFVIYGLAPRNSEVKELTPETFVLRPHLRTPCPYLEDTGCRAHGTIIKPLVCAGNPEINLLYSENIRKKRGCYEKFKCMRGKELDPKKITLLVN